jgi:DNA-binding NtrC family response regulator
VSDVVVQALQESYNTACAETSAAAMEHLRAGDIDAMLLDCTLPGGVDPQLLQMADNAGVPVIPDVGRSRHDRAGVHRFCASVHPEAVPS